MECPKEKVLVICSQRKEPCCRQAGMGGGSPTGYGRQGGALYCMQSGHPCYRDSGNYAINNALRDIDASLQTLCAYIHGLGGNGGGGASCNGGG